MALPEHALHSFIVRIWLEETAEEAPEVHWRGHITHIPSQKRRYFEDLNDIPVFVTPYLEDMGARLRRNAGNSMSSIFSFLRNRGDNPPVTLAPESGTSGESLGALATDASTAPPVIEAPAAEAANDRAATAVFAAPPPIFHSAPTQSDVLTALRAALEAYLPSGGTGLPAPSLSIIKIQEKPVGLGNYIGENPINQFGQVLKGGRLQATVRFHLWASAPNDADLAIDDLHGRLLTAKDDLWTAGFLRFVSLDSSLAEHLAPLSAWRRTADYDVLYEYRYIDSDEAQSLIARIPIHTDPEELNSPQRETAVVTDKMARWDDLTAPILQVRGPQPVHRFTALTFIPGSPPSDPVMLLRTFDGAAGAPTAFTNLGQWVTAVTHPTTPDRHAQITFATFSDFLAAFNPAGDPITLGDWDEDAALDDYTPLLLEFATPLTLPEGSDRLQLVYQPGSTDPHFDETAVVYIRSNPV